MDGRSRHGGRRRARRHDEVAERRAPNAPLRTARTARTKPPRSRASTPTPPARARRVGGRLSSVPWPTGAVSAAAPGSTERARRAVAPPTVRRRTRCASVRWKRR